MKDRLNRIIGFVVGGFEGTVGLGRGVGPMMEQAVGKRSAEPLMEEQEEERHAKALISEAIRVAAAVALQETVPTELAQIVPELVEPILLGRELEPDQDGLV